MQGITGRALGTGGPPVWDNFNSHGSATRAEMRARASRLFCAVDPRVQRVRVCGAGREKGAEAGDGDQLQLHHEIRLIARCRPSRSGPSV